MFLSNDATALILTPIVYSLVTRLRLPVLPFLFACTFIADSASFLLPVSNPINITIISRYPLDLLTFLRLLSLPCLLVIGINLGIFFWLYRSQLRGKFDIKGLPSIEEAVKHTAYFRYVGPNLTTVGSLATILWLLILRQRNLDVSGLDYFKVGIMVTPLMLVAGALAIWLLLG